MEDSPSSASEDDTKVATPLPKKRRGVQKRVVSVPIGDVEGSKSKGEGHPPSDSWAWRKYGQKPIKGSPYPRGYYRCSSSKGCPARKQVERSRLNPTMLIVTYVCDHNHPMPTTKANQSYSVTTATATATSPTTESELPAKTEELTIFTSQVDLDLSDDSPTLLSDFGWFNDAASTVVLDSPICLGNSSCMNNDVATRLKDEDEYLFADLGELPEGSVIFRHRNRMVESDDQNRRCSLSAVVPCTVCICWKGASVFQQDIKIYPKQQFQLLQNFRFFNRGRQRQNPLLAGKASTTPQLTVKPNR